MTEKFLLEKRIIANVELPRDVYGEESMARTETLAEKLTSSNSLAQRLSLVSQSIGSIQATGKNPNFKYDFVEESGVVEAVSKALAMHGVVFSATMEDVKQNQLELSGGRFTTHTLVKMMFSFRCTDTGEVWAVNWFGESTDSGDKGVAKAVVSAVKYALLKNLLIPKGGDDPEADPQGDVVERKAPVTKQTPAVPRATDPQPTRPKAAPVDDDDDRKAARELVYESCRKFGIATDSINLRKLASDAFNRRVATLYELKTADDWNVLAMWINDNCNPENKGDEDIPF